MVQVLIKQLKTMNKIPKSIVCCGGGTGGHIFPAVAIANEFRSRFPETKILFIGALGKMEMEKIPQEGFEIVGLPVMGLNRKSKLSNVQVVIKANGEQRVFVNVPRRNREASDNSRYR